MAGTMLRTSMSTLWPIGDISQKLKYLYVVLDRIGGVSEFIWPDIVVADQIELFEELLDILDNQIPHGQTKEDIFTFHPVIYGELSPDDRKYHTMKTLNIRTTESTELRGETLMHRAISLLTSEDKKVQKDVNRVIDILLKRVPCLLRYDRADDPKYDGQTPLHLAILLEDKDLVEKIAQTMSDDNIMKDTKYQPSGYVYGTEFRGTIMEAGSPLNVAALTLNKGIVKILMKSKIASIDRVNTNLDNVCHSLIHYAYQRPEKVDLVLGMLNYILNSRTAYGADKLIGTQMLLMMENKDGLNPLQLATRYQLHQIFKKFYEYEAYRLKKRRDCLLDDENYDVTEIETIPPTNPEKEKEKERNIKKEDNEVKDVDTKDHMSVLPAILLQHPAVAFKFLDFPPVRSVIDQKWMFYRFIFLFWGLLHLSLTVLLTVCAVWRSEMENDPASNLNESTNDRPRFVYRVTDDAFVTISGGVSVAIACVYIISEINRMVVRSKRKYIKQVTFRDLIIYPHSNFINRFFFCLFAVSVCLDFLLAATVTTYENYLLIVAVVVGWYLVLFFIQLLEHFSFFSSLIQTVFRDLLKFMVVMSVLLFAFSTAMYMAMQGSDASDDVFRRYSSTVLKMFSIMLGLGDIDILFRARHPAVSIGIFVIFVLLTTVLLLNALIAIMSNTCTDLLTKSGNVSAPILYYRLHKLSVVLLIEDMIPAVLRLQTGKEETLNRYQKGKVNRAIKRLTIRQTSLKTSAQTETDNPLAEKMQYMAHMVSRLKDKKSRKKDLRGTQVGPTQDQDVVKSNTGRAETGRMKKANSIPSSNVSITDQPLDETPT